MDMDDYSGFPQHTTSSLNEARNDTGRVAFCGPYVLSAITGYPISKVEMAINAYRNLPPDLRHRVKGTYADEVEGALAVAVYMGGGPSLMYSANAMRAFAEFAQTPEISS